MSNFAFINTPDWQDIYRSAVKAEAYTLGDPRTAVFYARRTVEVIVEWLYAFDPAFRRPYDDNLNALMQDIRFQRGVPHGVRQKMDAIRRLGNTAVHRSQSIKPREALAATRELFHIAYWFARTYTRGDPNSVPDRFDEALLPPPARDIQRQSRKQLLELDAQLKAKDDELRHARATVAALQAELETLRARVSATRVINAAIPDTHDYSEAETRRIFIDAYLREAGWNPQGPNVAEYRVEPMPNARGYGAADYVLWGADGLPLAVVEAKKASVEPERGRHQAELYADALEQMHGQRPVIYYTNGYDIWLWDDANRYPPRPVQGFYTRDELQRLVLRRSQARDLATIPIDPKIVDRAYQHEAIRRVTEQFTLRHRRALIVMATGTGKTRTAVALVDLLMQANWVKRVLFLADRTALVQQAVRAFKRHLPSSNPINLLEDKEAQAARVVVSTYQTIMNQIEQAGEDGRDPREAFGVGHFDLLIIDEAHRSVYQKYGAIFAYFDSLLLGLTATPRDDVDRNTYDLFNLEPGVPTFAYELDTAVADGYLVPPVPIAGETRFLREGIRYDDLSDDEKAEWDRLDWGDSEDIPTAVDSSALNQWLFNEDTVDKVLRSLLEHGLKVAGGDRLGKTIIFARNHKHAEFIARRFDANYPQYGGKFAQVIDHTVRYAHTLLDDFAKREAAPQIAISVDMLDTGVDVPEVLNLVFFKLVRSKTKFFQMLGRGTRLCPDLLGPGQDKQAFYVFDFCQNFEFFRYNPEGQKAARPLEPLSQRIFKTRLELLAALQQQTDPELQPLQVSIADALHGRVAAMNLNNFIVRPQRRTVEPFQQRARWDRLSQTDIHNLAQHVSGLPSALPDEPEEAARFDLLTLQLQLARLSGASQMAAHLQARVQLAAEELRAPEKQNITAVAAQNQLLEDLQRDAFWQEVSLPRLEDTRRALRDLMRFIQPRRRDILVTDFTDQLGEVTVTYLPDIQTGVNARQYQKKVEQFVRAHADYVVIHKIRWAMPLTQTDLEALEDFFYTSQEVESLDRFARVYGRSENLAAFIRGLVGLDRKAAKQKFARFLDGAAYTADQIQFVNYIIDYLTRNGTMDPGLLFDQPFTDIHYQGVSGVFPEEQAAELVNILTAINASVVPALGGAA